MSRKNRNRPARPAAPAAPMEAFTFGDPVPVLDRREIYDYLECVRVDSWYEPPISFHGLAVSFRSAPHHSSAVYVKRNILYNTFMPHRLLNRQTFDSWALDFLLFGNAYLELRKNRLGQPLGLKHCPAKFTRRGEDLETYWFVKYGYHSQPYPFPTGQVFHLIEPDINQELYGLPEYLAAHRVPPPMMGIIPQNTGGFGDVEKAAKVFVHNELLPLQSKMKQLNDWLGEEVIRFEPYSLDGDN